MFEFSHDPSHYLEASRVAMVDPRTIVADALRRLAKSHTSSLLVLEGDRPAWVVDGRRLAAEAIAAMHDGAPSFELPMFEFLPSGKFGDQLAADTYSVADRRVPLRPDSTLRQSIRLGDPNSPRQVHAIFDQARFAGLLFSHETFKGQIATAAPTYVCKRGHVNRDPDRGRCSQCPAKLETVK